MKITPSLLAAAILASTSASAEETHWSYHGKHGPKHWGGLCNSGLEQSPVNIDTTRVEHALLPDIEFNYHDSSTQVVNNGHTVQLNYDSGSSIRLGQDEYRLLQFHFHTPAEETVNGQRYDLVAHLVHKNDAGQLAVVAVLLNTGKENAFLKQFWHKIPPPKETTTDNSRINIAKLLPAITRYYTLPGSLTTPACSEGVRWLILKVPGSLSRQQLADFKRHYKMNARPVQALNQRTIQVGW